jgi:hypothetical protein
MPKVFIVTFQKHRGRADRLAKFVVIPSGVAAAIKEAWESTDADFQAEYSRGSGIAVEMKKGARRVL